MGIVPLVVHLLHCHRNNLFRGKNLAMAIKLMLLFFLVSTTTFLCCDAMATQAEIENIRICMVEDNKCASMDDLSRKCRKCVQKHTKAQQKSVDKFFKDKYGK